MRPWLSLGLGLSVLATGAWADEKALLALKAPEPIELRAIPVTDKPQSVKFARSVVQLRPEPWARLEIFQTDRPNTVEYVTWADGQIEMDAATAAVFRDEMKAAGVPVEGVSESLFAEDAAAELQIGVRITDMKARLCKGCGWSTPLSSWVGVTTMSARWEVYSRLQGRVLLALDTRGGFTAPRGGLRGDPERLVYEAFRDNVRHLIDSEDFRKILTNTGVATAPLQSKLAPIALLGGGEKARSITSAADAVAAVFSGNGHGTGFLVSSDGYLLTNQHVVGGAKFVKVRWPDRTESVGEVIRFDRRRDVALIKVGSVTRMPLALRSGAGKLGETVFAIGTPLDQKFQGTVTKGVVSASRIYDGLNFIQSDVTVNAGNSGGPLIDESGAVIGLTVSGYQVNGAPAGINLFIPIADALASLALRPAS